MPPTGLIGQPPRSQSGRKPRSEVLVDELLELIVDDEHQSASGTAQHVGPGSLEEGLASLLLVDLCPGVQGSVVVLLAARLRSKYMRLSIFTQLERCWSDTAPIGCYKKKKQFLAPIYSLAKI